MTKKSKNTTTGRKTKRAIKKSTPVGVKDKVAETLPITIDTTIEKDTIVNEELIITKSDGEVLSLAPASSIPQGFTAPHTDLALIREHLDALTRSPFKDALTKILGSQPDIKHISMYADKYPDRWGQLVAIFARLAGYTPELKIEGTINTEAKAMSDSELETAIEEIRKAMAKEDAQATGQAIDPAKKELLTTPSDKDNTTLEDTTEDASDDAGDTNDAHLCTPHTP